MFEATIQTVKHHQQRYDTVGDYYTDPRGVIHFTISELGDWKMEALITVHELIEKILTKHAGVSEAEITEFDVNWNKTPDDKYGEPGNDPGSPYYHQHRVATMIEAALAIELGVDWNEYERRVNEL